MLALLEGRLGPSPPVPGVSNLRVGPRTFRKTREIPIVRFHRPSLRRNMLKDVSMAEAATPAEAAEGMWQTVERL